MPTPVNPTEKANFIAIVNARNPIEAERLLTVFVNYEDVPTVIGRQEIDFCSNNQYLTEAMGTLDAGALLTAGVYYNQSLNVPAVDPLIWINSSTTSAINITASREGFSIVGRSTVKSVILSAAVRINWFYIDAGSSLDILDGSATGASIGTLTIPYLRSTPGKLGIAKFGTIIGATKIAAGAYYGGLEAVDPENVCTIPVTAMSATEITKNSILVSWVPPVSGYLFINPFFRKTGSKVWILATEVDGDFEDNTGFTFRYLDSDTYYDFKATVICNNGGYAETQITTQTICCGAGTQMALYKQCPITILIKTSPDPSITQTLCNGVTIRKEYPAGPTITIPYLASVNVAILQPFVIDNANYQLMPFDPYAGTWDATGTPVMTFVDGNVVTVNVSVPA